MKKTFLLDTGILLSSPRAIFSFDEHDVFVCYDTIRELAAMRKTPGETGANAREALRLIAEYTNKQLPGEQSGSLYIYSRNAIPNDTRSNAFGCNDNRNSTGGPSHTFPVVPVNAYHTEATEFPIIRAYHEIAAMRENPILVSNNSMTKICAEMEGVIIQPYLHERVAPPLEQYRGRRTAYVPGHLIDELYAKKIISVSQNELGDEPVSENEYLMLQDNTNEQHTALARYRRGKLYTLCDVEPYGVTPRKVGQRFAIDALMTPVDEIPLVILKGPAGTAKTFLSLAAGLEQVVNEKVYDRILVSRPNIKFDNDIGYLKGSEEEKIGPLIRPVMDNLELLCRTMAPVRKGNTTINNYVQDLFNDGTVAAQAMAYMRGRSVANTYIIIDEAQNMSPTQAFGIISRVGVGAKVVLAGDPEQIDNPELDSRNNGLSYASEKMQGSPYCAQVTFEPEECVRSELALEAIRRMSNKPSGI